MQIAGQIDDVFRTTTHHALGLCVETGANIGFIISKCGLQSGARHYTESTNISGFTYLEFQQRYFKAWWQRYFCPRIGDAADRVLQYTEPFSKYRDEKYDELSASDKEKFDEIRADHGGTVTLFSMFNYRALSPKRKRKASTVWT